MKLLRIYECLCDETRLRIVNLLSQGPLCVCHFQDLLGVPQVKVSKHLAYLKAKEMVISTRHQNWMIYSLPARRSPELEANLKCLQDCVQTEPIFRKDLAKLAKLLPTVAWLSEATCCAESPDRKRTAASAKA